jgi:PQQ enzyme repeat
LTIKQLIDRGAFKIPGDDKVYTGKKETQFIAIDSKTGKVLSQYGTPSAAFLGAKCRAPRDVLDELDDECDATIDSRDILMIGKTGIALVIIFLRFSLPPYDYFGRGTHLGRDVY